MDITVILISGILFALLTFYLNNRLQLGGVMASAGVSVLTAAFFHFFPELLNAELTNTIPVIAMGASFIGMASSRIIKKYWIIGVAGLFFSFIFLVTGTFFEGFGGSLGTTAAISLAAVCGIFQLGKIPALFKN
ncbi:hypothetical protein FLP08_00335 [Gramella aestuarii]|uniref:Uncharacterized protein n=1 Tax=Christiangramia aestuarii TaxID=1028746 RepID=A0A7M3SWM7_9FLAO|nr:hypothetical protein [Christiangramia aestuarii]